jgi:hypothetical protein
MEMISHNNSDLKMQGRRVLRESRKMLALTVRGHFGDFALKGDSTKMSGANSGMV